MRGLIDNGRKHEGEATDEQHPHHDDRDLEDAHLTRREEVPVKTVPGTVLLLSGSLATDILETSCLFRPSA